MSIKVYHGSNGIITSPDWTKSPEVQDIIMSGVIGSIAVEISESLGLTPVDALMDFYESDTCRRLHDKSTRLYLFSDKYVAEEYIMERNQAV